MIPLNSRAKKKNKIRTVIWFSEINVIDDVRARIVKLHTTPVGDLEQFNVLEILVINVHDDKTSHLSCSFAEGRTSCYYHVVSFINELQNIFYCRGATKLATGHLNNLIQNKASNGHDTSSVEGANKIKESYRKLPISLNWTSSASAFRKSKSYPRDCVAV